MHIVQLERTLLKGGGGAIVPNHQMPGDDWGQWPPPPPFKSVRFPGFAWNAIFLKSSWYGEIKSDVYMIFRGIQRCLDDI